MTPTDEQTSILSLQRSTSSNIMVNALAGTGKTTTLQLLQAEKAPALCIAFNKRAAEDMEKKFGGSTTTIRTFNSLGHRVWMKAVSNKLLLKPDKCREILREHINTLKGQDKKDAWDAYWPVLEAVGLAKSLGYIPEGIFPHARRLCTLEALTTRLEAVPTPLVLSLLDFVLTKSIQTAYNGWIDFNDQIYMPALFGGTFPRFPHNYIDEGQDLNPVNHAMLDKLGGGRLCIVGDRNQSIYAFRGAVTSGMEVIRSRFNCEERDLSVSFRCPQAVVEAARWRVPNFKWAKPGGKVEILQTLEAKAIPEGAAIICRNNAPLFRTALGLLMQSRSVSVSGSELGPKLVRLLQRICGENDSQETMLGKIEAWKAEKLENSQAPDRVRDEAECLKIFASFGKNLSQAVAYVEHIFKQQGAIKLLTGHKAKGGEWPIVYHLDPWLCKDDEEQDLNLRYVITTRAEEELYEIDSRDIRWN